MAFVNAWRMGNVHFLCGRQSKLYVNLRDRQCGGATGPITNVAASNETKSVLKQRDMFLNCRSLPIIWRETLEIDFYWCLHNLLLKPNLAQASPSRLKNEEPP
jgi:hypothetical protein